MNKFEETMAILEDNFGNGKDNIISLATISLKAASNEMPCPAVRDIDAYYEDGVFYAVTYAKSNKILEIVSNENKPVRKPYPNPNSKLCIPQIKDIRL